MEDIGRRRSESRRLARALAMSASENDSAARMASQPARRRGRALEEEEHVDEQHTVADPVADIEQWKPCKRAKLIHASDCPQRLTLVTGQNAGDALYQAQAGGAAPTENAVLKLQMAELQFVIQQKSEQLKQQKKQLQQAQESHHHSEAAHATHEQQLQASLQAMQSRLAQTLQDANVSFQNQQAQLVQTQQNASAQLQQLQAGLIAAMTAKDMWEAKYKQDVTSLRKQAKAKDKELLSTRNIFKMQMQQAQDEVSSWQQKHVQGVNARRQLEEHLIARLNAAADASHAREQQLNATVSTLQARAQQLQQALQNQQQQMAHLHEQYTIQAGRLSDVISERDCLAGILLPPMFNDLDIIDASSEQDDTAASYESGTAALECDSNEVSTRVDGGFGDSASATGSATHNDASQIASHPLMLIDVDLPGSSNLFDLPEQLLDSIVKQLEPADQRSLMCTCKGMAQQVMNTRAFGENTQPVICCVSKDTSPKGVVQVLTWAPNIRLCFDATVDKPFTTEYGRRLRAVAKQGVKGTSGPSRVECMRTSTQGCCFPGVQRIIVKAKAILPHLSELFGCCPNAHELDIQFAVNDWAMSHIVKVPGITLLCVAGFDGLVRDISKLQCSWEQLQIHSEVLEFTILGCIPLKSLKQPIKWTSPTTLKFVQLPQQWYTYTSHCVQRAAVNVSTAPDASIDIGDSQLFYFLPKLAPQDSSQCHLITTALDLVNMMWTARFTYQQRHYPCIPHAVVQHTVLLVKPSDGEDHSAVQWTDLPADFFQ